MPALKMTQFRVLNFRNIDDSDWIPIERVTVLVGRNESGKSALLKALHKFNPATPEPYEPQREFPRDRFTKEFRSGADWPVCQVEFEVDDDLQKQFLQEGEFAQLPRRITFTRYYEGPFKVEFSPEPLEADLMPAPLVAALDEFTNGMATVDLKTPKETEEDGDDGQVPEESPDLRGLLRGWASEMRSAASGLTSLKSAEGVALLTKVVKEAGTHSHPAVAPFVGTLTTTAQTLLAQAKKPSAIPRLKELAISRLPVFIYFEQYGTLDSAVYLPQFLESLGREPNNPKVRTINAMFKHVRLTAQEVNDLGIDRLDEAKRANQTLTPAMIAEETRKKELREVKLNSASLDITDRFSNWWHQRRHQIRYQADGPHFRIWVADDRRPGVQIELESRSKGFQWFFSFYLVFLVESEEFHKEAILLLDEPGLDLHPTAQQELITFFEDLARSNQLLYTSHSPWLIDGEHLERVRPVTEDETGHSHVSVGMWPDDRETIFPLQAAAGYAMVTSLLQAKKNLLLEGMADYLYLQGLSLLLRAAGRQALPDDVYLTPCGGAQQMGYVASLFLGQRIRPVILLDSDETGRTRMKSLLKNLYAGKQTNFILLEEVLGLPECEIEDVVGESLILAAASQIAGAAIVLDPSEAGLSLPDRIERAAARAGIALGDGWKAEIARRLVSTWASTDPAAFPIDVLDRAERLVRAVIERFEVAGIRQP